MPRKSKKNEHEGIICKPQSAGELAEAISNGRWKAAPHLELIDHLLLELSRRHISRLIINLPPRHGKSELISKYFPAWYLSQFPGHRIILTSYESSFASSWGRKVRGLIEEFGETTLGIGIDPSSKAVDNFTLAGTEGGMSCAGAGGAITGKGADLLIIDDPVKNDAEAHSPVIRENIWEWFISTAFTRLEPGGIVVIVMTRWHEDDLCGRIARHNEILLLGENWRSQAAEAPPDAWCLLRLPALALEADPLGRKPGEPLWAARFPEDRLASIRKQVGSYWFSALYQQDPAKDQSGIFRREYFRYFKIEGDNYIVFPGSDTSAQNYPRQMCSIFCVADLAVKSDETADYTAIIVFAVTRDKKILVLDVMRERFSGADHLNLLKSIHQKWNPLLIGIESVQYQYSLIEIARREGLPVSELKADKDKVSRALPVAAKMESGNVFFRSGAAWLPEFEEELLAFPDGRYDDQADALAYSVRMSEPHSGIMPAGISLKRIF